MSTTINLIINKDALPSTSTKVNIKHVYLCDKQTCAKLSFRAQLIKKNGEHFCPAPGCDSTVTNITFTELGRRFAGV